MYKLRASWLCSVICQIGVICINLPAGQLVQPESPWLL
jgi:hypothetical protein